MFNGIPIEIREIRFPAARSTESGRTGRGSVPGHFVGHFEDTAAACDRSMGLLKAAGRAVTFHFAIDQVDHLAQPTDASAIKDESDARQMQQMIVINFNGLCFYPFNPSFDTDRGEFVVQSLQQFIRGSDMQSQHQHVLHKPHTVIHTVESQNFLNGAHSRL